MRILLILFASIGFLKPASAENSSPGSRFPSLNVGQNTKGVFFRTNTTSAPYYLVNNPIDLASYIGKADSSLGNFRKVIYISEHFQEFTQENNALIAHDYILSVGGFAVLEDQVLTLTDFKAYSSARDRSKRVILEIVSHSVSFLVAPGIATQANHFREKHH